MKHCAFGGLAHHSCDYHSLCDKHLDMRVRYTSLRTVFLLSRSGGDARRQKNEINDT